MKKNTNYSAWVSFKLGHYLFLVLAILSVLATRVTAQITISGSNGVDGTYPTLTTASTGAFAKLNSVSQSGKTITVTITSDVTTEPGTTALTGLTAAWTKLTIKPSGVRTISGTIAGPLVTLSGSVCSNVVIDGLNDGTNSLTFSNAGTASATTIKFLSGASNDSIKNCTILGSTITAASGTILFSTGANNNNVITACNIGPVNASTATPVNAIYVVAGAVGDDAGGTISNCNIYDYFSATATSVGFLQAGSASFTGTGWTISGNKFYQTVSRTITSGTATKYCAISLTTGTDGWTIANNTIGFGTSSGILRTTYTCAASTAITPVFRAIDIVSIGTTNTSKLDGNVIAGISFTTNSLAGSSSGTAPGIFNGIVVSGTSASYPLSLGTVAPNIIGTPTARDSAICNATTGAANIYVAGIYITSTNNVVINNNVVQSITCFSTIQSSSFYFVGIHTAGAAGIFNLSNNRIGSSSANDITIGTTSLGSTTYSTALSNMNGIFTANTGNVTIKGDTVQNLTFYSNSGAVQLVMNGILCNANGLGTLTVGGTAAGEGNLISNISLSPTVANANALLRGINLGANAGAQALVCSGNKVTGISSTGTSVSTGSSAAVIGILDGAAKTATHTFDKDTVTALSVTPAGVGTTTTQVSGITIAATTAAGAYTVTRNVIYGFNHNSSGGGIINGIDYVTGSSSTASALYNNMISFVTNSGISIRGFLNQSATAGSVANYYHNSVYLGGSPSTNSGSVTSAFHRTSTAAVVIKNNILVNERSGSGTHYCVFNTSASNWTSDYNLLGSSSSNAATIGSWLGSNKDFPGWQTSSGGDSHSASGPNSTKLSFTDVANGNLKLNMAAGVITPVDSGGTPIATVTTDFEGDARNASFPDIGADEISGYLTSDVAAYSFVNPANGGVVGIAAFNPKAQFSDSGAFRTNVPIRYRIINSSSVEVYNQTATASILTFGSPTTVTFPACSLSVGTYTIQIIAEMTTDLNRSNDTLNGTMTVLPPLCDVDHGGPYHIGTAQAAPFNTLTNAVARLNLVGVSCAVTFILDDALYSSATETLPISINNFYGTSSINTVTIRPNTTNVTLRSVNPAAPLAVIQFDGAKNVIIDGRPGGTGGLNTTNLTIEHQNNGGNSLLGAVRFINDATSDQVIYSNLKGANTSTTGGVVVFGGTTGTTGNDSNTVDNCNITDLTGFGTPANGVYASGSATFPNDHNTISNCNISNYFGATAQSAGVIFSAGNTDCTISVNKFFQTSSRTFTSSAFHEGIIINNSSGNNFQIINNTIGFASSAGTGVYTLTGSSNQFAAIEISSAGTTTATTIRGNTITAISQTTDGSSFGTGTYSSLILVGTGLVNIGDALGGNTFGSMDGSTSITFNATSTASFSGEVYAIYSAAASPITIKKNQIGSMKSIVGNTSNSQKFIPISFDPSAVPTTVIVDSNIVGGTGNTFATGAIEQSATTTSNTTRLIGISTGFSTTNNTAAHSIRGNTVRNLLTNANNINAAPSNGLTGILFNETSITSPAIISGNTIHSLTNSNALNSMTVDGIYMVAGSGSATKTISKNIIHSLSVNSANAGTVNIKGIEIGAISNNVTVSNNMVRLGFNPDGTSMTGSFIISGIYDNTTSSNFYYFNSAYIGGTASGSTLASFAFVMAGTATGPRIVENNLFINDRSGGSANTQGAMSVFANSNLTSNYNVYNAGGGTPAFLCRYSSINYSTLNAYRTAISGNANGTAQFEDHSFVNDPSFVNSTGNTSTVNLHLTASNPLLDGTGVTIGTIADDIDGDTRNSPPDIGADEMAIICAPPSALNQVVTNVTCNAANNGTITTNPSGGTSPYNYSWSSGATTQNISGLVPGTYSVIVTATGGCTVSFGPFTISQPTVLSVSCSATDAVCFGGSGSASVTPSGGTGAYTYSWNNSGTTATISGISAGTYTATVTDGNGCTQTCQSIIHQPTALNPSCSGTNVTCNAGNNGSASVSVSGGTGAYTYSWNNGATDASINSLTAGTYTITVTDANNCTAQCSYVVTQPTAVAPVCSGSNISCYGGSNGSASVSVSGGTEAYTYSWNNGASTSSATGLSTGTYTVVVTDASGCTGSCTYVVTQPAAVTVTASHTDPVCRGSDLFLFASVSGGTGPYTYSWSSPNSPADPIANPTITTVDFADAGTYSVTVNDVNGCTSNTSSTIVIVHGRPSGILDGDTTICQGGTARLHISADGVGTVYGTLNDGSSYSGIPIDVYAYVTSNIIGNHTYYVATMHDNYCAGIPETDFFASDEGHVHVIACSPDISLKLFIQGYYNTGSGMMDNGITGGCLYVSGISSNPSEADSVRVSFVDSALNTVAYSFTGVVHNNGTLSGNFLGTMVNNRYYIKITHRNAIETWSKFTVLLTVTGSNYDFSTSNAKAYGNNEVEVDPGVWALYNGDISHRVTSGAQDGVIESSDYSDEENGVNLGLTGYQITDLNGDGVVDGKDYLVIEQNIFYTVVSIHP